MTSYYDLVRRLVSADNDCLPYDYEQGLCAWCRTGTDAEHPERYNSLHPEKFTATPHALDCPYAEATAILARLKPHEFKGRSDRDCEVCRWPDRSAAHFRDIPAHPVPDGVHPEFQFSEEGADWLDLNMPEEPEHTGWSGEPHPGRHF